MTDNNWFIKGGKAYQATKETPRRLYYNPHSRWRDSEFVEKSHVLLRNLSEEIAAAIEAAFTKESEASAESRADHNERCRGYAEERKAAVSLILGEPS